uniref:G-protein coupled receptors family 1 profile domain-containing protein n=1 Tax=Plectus sambesii TaxID=2011161 RepID=A0A914X1S7_9BILA
MKAIDAGVRLLPLVSLPLLASPALSHYSGARAPRRRRSTPLQSGTAPLRHFLPSADAVSSGLLLQSGRTLFSRRFPQLLATPLVCAGALLVVGQRRLVQRKETSHRRHLPPMTATVPINSSLRLTPGQQNRSADEVKTFMRVTYSLTIPVILLLCLLAIIANVVVLLSIRSIRAVNFTATLKLTFSLAASDIWTSVVVAVSLFYNSYLPTVYDLPATSACFPLALEALRTGGLLTGVFHLLALSVNHYISIARPFDYQRIMNSAATVAIVGGMWALPPGALLVFFHSLPGAGFNTPGGKCMNIMFYSTIWFRLLISLLIIGLMTVMCSLYARVMIILGRLRAKFDSNKRSQQQLSRQRKTVMTTWLVFGTFLVGWLPSSVLFVLTATGMPLNLRPDATLADRVPIVLLSLTALSLVMIKSLTNPIIYATRIPEIRDYIASVWSKLGPCRCSNEDASSTLLTEETNLRITVDNGGNYRKVPEGTKV